MNILYVLIVIYCTPHLPETCYGVNVTQLPPVPKAVCETVGEAAKRSGAHMYECVAIPKLD